VTVNPREVVERAASRTSIPMVAEFLATDPGGKIEAFTKSMLDETKADLEAEDVSDEEATEHLSAAILVFTLEGMLRDQLRSSGVASTSLEYAEVGV
jgi:hypothetical protein